MELPVKSDINSCKTDVSCLFDNNKGPFIGLHIPSDYCVLDRFKFLSGSIPSIRMTLVKR